ncbi:hypothetical protein TGAM01_v203780 [Trichoderma gamsii]|uniref:Uncharacterized protein n=1 Tax=Trichoderma gamsii TaxID=398673 RepID=A0A2P4ZSX7_9HYPO|nr:hypothetical protein TGAM01_v203780 [Trichoderma gamsii]PON27399.1 hypothetical protein TGAM01_v203780 [Trichoderma gamsii]
MAFEAAANAFFLREKRKLARHVDIPNCRKPYDFAIIICWWLKMAAFGWRFTKLRRAH